MDAEIRRLTYVPRFGGAKQGSAPSLIAELPAFLRSDEPRHTAKPSELRLEARIADLERELKESEHRHHEALAATQQKAAEEKAAALAEQAARLGQEWSGSVLTAVASFEQGAAEYFAEAEAVVVRLALGIAARVLHREAQLDPLMLRGPVRVALEDAQQTTGCVLEVTAGMVEQWQRWLSTEDTNATRVLVRGKEDAAAGHCRLEIGASTADISVGAQLAEIERGFFDLLQRRPAARAGASQ